MINKPVIAVDFDGTITKHIGHLHIGEPVPDAIRVIKRLIREKEAKIILHTMRGGRQERDAVGYLAKNGIVPFGVNQNPLQPGSDYRHSRKIWADIYIDDSAVGCPLIYEEGSRPFVDWLEVEKMLFT